MSSRRLLRPSNSSRKLASVIAKQMAAMMPNMFVQFNQAMNASGNSSANEDVNPTRCNFKYFNSCKPPTFSGDEGATGLLQWFEGMENTFIMSDCPNDRKVRYAASALQKRALTWWVGEKRNRGEEAAIALSWAEFKTIMTAEFCPRNEVKKLEVEFWDLKQDSGESLAYVNRFQ